MHVTFAYFSLIRAERQVCDSGGPKLAGKYLTYKMFGYKELASSHKHSQKIFTAGA